MSSDKQQTPDQHLQAAKEAVANDNGFDTWDIAPTIEKASMIQTAAILALTNQAEEFEKEKAKLQASIDEWKVRYELLNESFANSLKF